jgi:hypothetical protein
MAHKGNVTMAGRKTSNPYAVVAWKSFVVFETVSSVVGTLSACSVTKDGKHWDAALPLVDTDIVTT